MAEAALAQTAAMAQSSLSKAQKAALIFLFLEERGAASLFEHMSDEEIQVIGSTLLKMQEIPIEDMSQVLREFYDILGKPAEDYSGKRLFKKLVEKTLPDERRGKIFSVSDIRGGKGSQDNPLENMFAEIGAEKTFEMIRDEHPQTVAVILTLIKPTLAKTILALVGPDQQTDILYRMSVLSTVSEDVLRMLADVYGPKIEALKSSGVTEVEEKAGGLDVPGIDTVLKYLRSQDWKKSEEIVAEIGKFNADVAKAISKRLFTMEDLLRTDNNGMRALLKNIESSDLTLALKEVAPNIQNLFFQNMSTRAVTLLKDDMEVLQAKPEDMEAATDRILEAAKKLVQAGEVILEALKED